MACGERLAAGVEAVEGPSSSSTQVRCLGQVDTQDLAGITVSHGLPLFWTGTWPEATERGCAARTGMVALAHGMTPMRGWRTGEPWPVRQPGQDGGERGLQLVLRGHAGIRGRVEQEASGQVGGHLRDEGRWTLRAPREQVGLVRADAVALPRVSARTASCDVMRGSSIHASAAAARGLPRKPLRRSPRPRRASPAAVAQSLLRLVEVDVLGVAAGGEAITRSKGSATVTW